MSVCVLASVLVLISLVSMDLLSVSDFEVDGQQAWRQCCTGSRAAQESEREHGNNPSPVDAGVSEDAVPKRS